MKFFQTRFLRSGVKLSVELKELNRSRKFDDVILKCNANTQLDNISLTFLLQAHFRKNQFQEALDVFHNMKTRYGVVPDQIHHSIILNGLIGYNPKLAEEIFHGMLKNEKNIIVGVFNTMIKVYTNARQIEKVTELVQVMKIRNVKMDFMTYSSLIYAYGLVYDVNHAQIYYDHMKKDQDVDLATYSTMIGVLNWNRKYVDAERVWCEMKERGLFPESEITLTNVVKALMEVGKAEEAETLFLQRLKHISATPNILSLLCRVFLKVGDHGKVDHYWKLLLESPKDDRFDYHFMSNLMVEYYSDRKDAKKLSELISAIEITPTIFISMCKAVIHPELMEDVISISDKISAKYPPSQQFSLFDYALESTYLTSSFESLKQFILKFAPLIGATPTQMFQKLLIFDINANELDRALLLLEFTQMEKLRIDEKVYNQLLEALCRSDDYKPQILQITSMMRKKNLKQDYLPILKMYLRTKSNKMTKIVIGLIKQSKQRSVEFFETLLDHPHLMIANLDHTVPKEVFLQVLFKYYQRGDKIMQQLVLKQYCNEKMFQRRTQL